MFIKACIMWFKLNTTDKAYKWGDFWFGIGFAGTWVKDTIECHYIKNNLMAIYKFAKENIKEA